MQGQPTRHTMNRRAFCQSAGLALAAIPLASSIALAQGATPAPGGATSRLADMLALVPAMLPAIENPAMLTMSFADIAAQLETTGVTPPDSMDDESASMWYAATRGLAMPMEATQYLNSWRDDYGFDLFQADQTVSVDLPPMHLSLYRGRFDHDAIRATLTANGYREVEVDGYTLLSLRDDFEQDVSSDFVYKLAAMNHAAFLEDGTIAFSSVKAALVAVLDVANGLAPAMVEQAGISTLVEQAPSDLVSVILINGTMLAMDVPASLIDLEPGATPDISAIATEIAETSEMPPIVMALLGATAGGPLVGDDIETPADVPDARAVAVALFLSPEHASAAAPVIEERLETDLSDATTRPYREMFPEFEVRAVPSAPLVIIDLAVQPGASTSILFQMLYARDLGFLAW